MTQQFTLTLSVNNLPPTITFVGFIDENTDFNSLQLPQDRSFILNLDQVKGVNSMGLRNWIAWLRRFQDRLFVYRFCRPSLVHQMNILQGFLPSTAVIESFYVPYHCSHCGEEVDQLVQKDIHFQYNHTSRELNNSIPEQIPCQKCHKFMSLDVLQDKYFSFLKPRR